MINEKIEYVFLTFAYLINFTVIALTFEIPIVIVLLCVDRWFKIIPAYGTYMYCLLSFLN